MKRTIETPKTAKDGLINSIQVAINQVHDHQPQEAWYTLSGLVDDLECEVYEILMQGIHATHIVKDRMWQIMSILRAGRTWEAIKALEDARNGIIESANVKMDDSPVDMTPDASGVNKR